MTTGDSQEALDLVPQGAVLGWSGERLVERTAEHRHWHQKLDRMLRELRGKAGL